ncbi:CTP-dependent diacylglycerol kinase 1 [[Candida] railenensis]|uniref:CTP-dependent diacylglycerol kinase 1 n=1 Tax=[Candida] railenensis TaxID=45579 RepID=A0A9P0QT09_9ASCO|nr:CTP-dependent diacylglycerol kinase 1 [[Candida] railenensis]
MNPSGPLMLNSSIELQKRAHTTLKNRLHISIVDSDTDSTEYDSESESEALLKDVTTVEEKSSFRQFARKYELSRKGFHSFTGLFTVWLYVNGINQRQLVVPLVIMAGLCFAQDFIRFRNPAFNKQFIKYYGFMMRESEHDRYNGILFFLLGLILTSSFLPKDLAVMCNFLLSWADTSASFVGRLYGKYTPKISANKSLAGCAASFATGVFSCYLLYGALVPRYTDKVDLPGDILYQRDSSKLDLHLYAVLCGLIASISECIEVGIDDNFTIPVFSGIFLFGLVKVMQ